MIAITASSWLYFNEKNYFLLFFTNQNKTKKLTQISFDDNHRIQDPKLNKKKKNEFFYLKKWKWRWPLQFLSAEPVISNWPSVVASYITYQLSTINVLFLCIFLLPKPCKAIDDRTMQRKTWAYQRKISKSTNKR